MSVYVLSGDFVSAIASAEEERDRDPGNPVPHIRLGTIYARAGRMDDARREAELSAGPLISTRPGPENDRLSRAVLWATLGKPEEARLLTGEWEEASRTRYVNLSLIAGLYAVLSERERALDCLERECQVGDHTLWFTYLWTCFDSIRDDPRFRSMLGRLNLPTDGEEASRKTEQAID